MEETLQEQSTQSKSLEFKFSDLVSQFQEMREEIVRLRTLEESVKSSLDENTRKRRREQDALRKRTARAEQKAAKKQQETDVSEEMAVPIDNFSHLPCDSENIIFSTKSIAQENEYNDARSSGSLPVETLNPNEQPVDRSHVYSNIAIDRVFITTVGPNTIRGSGVGGTEKDPEFLASTIVSFFTHTISINALKDVAAATMEARILQAKATLCPRKGHSARRTLGTDKAVNISGRVSNRTLTDAIHASLLALDHRIVQQDLIQRAVVVNITGDSSQFGEHDMLGQVLDLTFIESDGEDALGTPRHKIIRMTVSPNATSTGDKISLDVMRADGTMFGKEVPEHMVGQLSSSGHLYAIMNHDCVYVSMDKGSESMGGGKGRNGHILRHSFYGRGSPLEQIFGTREAIEAVMKSENWSYLSDVMEFLGIPKAQQFPFSARPLPRRLDTSAPVSTVPFQIRILKRVRGKNKGEQPTVLSQTVESHNSRKSTEIDPLCFLPVFEDEKGLPIGNYCDKHLLDRVVVAFTKPEKKHMTSALLVVRIIREQKNHVKLKLHANMVMGIKGYKPAGKPQLAVREALPDAVVEDMRERFPRGWKRQDEAVETRWNQVHKTVSDVAEKGQFLAAIMPLALAEGKEDAKIEAAKAVCSTEGFRDEKKIRFSAKTGRAFKILVSPSRILYMAVIRMIYKLAWQPLLAACAHRSEFGSSAMRGLGSMARNVDFVLTRGLFVARSWHVHYPLGHRGFPEFKSKRGPAALSSRLEKLLTLLQLYGQFYTSSMESAVRELRETIKMACKMDGPILSEEHQALYVKDLDSWKLLQPDEVPDMNSNAQKVGAALWLVQYQTNRAAVCLRKKAAGNVSCPLGFLAALYDFHRVPFVPETGEGEEEVYFDIATYKALASAGLLLLQMKEALQAHGDNLHNCLPEPLRTLVKDHLDDLANFAAGEQVDFESKGSVRHGSERVSYPKPVTAFPGLYELALKACARPTNNNTVESKWSLLTYRHQAHVRNVGVEYMSAVFRQKDFLSMSMLSELRSPDFHRMIKEARTFRSKHKDEITSFYRLDQLESESRKAQHTNTRDVYSCSNITEDVRKEKQPKTKRTKNSAQKQKARLDRRRNDQSNSDESSVSADEQSSEAQESAPVSENESEDDPTESLQDQEQDNDIEYSPAVEEFARSDDDALDSAGSVDVSASADPGAIVPASSQRLVPSQSSQGASPEGFESPADLPAGAVSSNSNAAAEERSSSCEHGRSEQDAQGHKPLADENESDDSDLSSWSGDDDGQADQDEEQGSTFKGPLSHPFPDPRDLTDEEAKQISPFKLSYIRYLVIKEKWVSTEVRYDAPSSRRQARITETLILTRLDKKQFPLMESRCGLFYVLYNDDGLELINVEKVFWKDFKSNDKKVCISYSRVLSTQNAIDQCKSANDFHVTSPSGLSRVTSLGSRSLKKYLRPADQKGSTLTVHKGDFEYHSVAENIVGFVAWEPLGQRLDRSAQDRKQLLGQINKNLAKGQVKISSLEEVDYVFCGPDFSEHDDT